MALSSSSSSSSLSALLLRVFLLLHLCGLGTTTSSSASKKTPQDKCALKVLTGSDGARKLPVTFKTDNCSLLYPAGKNVIHEVMEVTFSHLSCEDQAAVVVHWAASPLGIEHIKGFRVYLEDKNPERKQCQSLVLKEPRQLNYSYKSTKLSSHPFSGLSFDTDYMIRVVPFPSLMNESFFPPSFLRTNSCEVLLGSESLVCKPFWKPKWLNVSQFGSNLHVSFDPAPLTFHLSVYYVFYKLRQDGPFRTQRCKPDLNQPRTTCVLKNVTPGTYTIELRDDNNTTRRQTQFHVSQVHSPWAGPIRAMAITVPLVILSAFATLFTVMCRKKQQENIYSHLDEESSESSNQSAALISERPWPRPKVFLCYSSRDCPKHSSVVQAFAYFLQDFCGCEVVLDLWEHLDMCREGQMSWLSRQLDEADFIITICSKGLRYFTEKKSRRGKTPVSRRGNSGANPAPKDGGPHGSDLFLVAVAMIAEQLRSTKQSEKELSRFMAVYFDYSTENDIPTALSLAPRLKLMDQLPQLFSLLHSSHASLWDGAPPNVSRRNYFRSKSGRSLYVSICNMHQFISQSPDWFDQQLHGPQTAGPAHSAPPVSCEAAATATAATATAKPQSGLVLNEVTAKTLDSAPKRNLVLLAPGSRPESEAGSSLSPSYSPGYDPGPHCSRSLPRGSSRCSSGRSAPSSPSCSSALSSVNVPCLKVPSFSGPPSSLDKLRPPQDPEQGGLGLDRGAGAAAEPSPPEPPPRDSGIYDSSVPSSELSIPLMDGLSHDHVDSSSLADSESSSSGLGDEEPPTVSSLSCSATTVCKAELHRQDAPVMSL